MRLFPLIFTLLNTDSAIHKQQYVFGPVFSRRLGRSLGIDVVPFKTCSYDCIYCQLGKTSHKSIERKEYVPLEKVVEELKSKINTNPDYITISGSGEPTLYSRLGELIEIIKTFSKIPVVVITNGSLLWMKEVREQLKNADIVIPSLDAYDDESFARINIPSKEITFSKMYEGLKKFRDEFKGQIWLEVFIIDSCELEEEVKKIASLAKEINADKIQLNTVTRPPAEKSVQNVPYEKMKELLKYFGDNAEIISAREDSIQKNKKKFKDKTNFEQEIIEMAQRHPCNLNDIVIGLGISNEHAEKFITKLLSEKRIIKTNINGKDYFQI